MKTAVVEADTLLGLVEREIARLQAACKRADMLLAECERRQTAERAGRENNEHHPN